MNVGQPFSPDFLRKLQQLRIRTRRTFLGSRQGSHRSLRRGHGLEFADYRQYSPGDDFRHIDWNVLGRTDRLYVRQFREEQDLNVILIIDTSASMAYPEGGTKFQYAAELALALGFIALTDGDAVTLAPLGQALPPHYRGSRALARMGKALAEITPGGENNLVDSVRAALSGMKLPGKCFFISDFLAPAAEIYSALDLIRARNFDLTLLQLLAPNELAFDPALVGHELVDAETGERFTVGSSGAFPLEYAKLLASHVGDLEKFAQKAEVQHVLLSTAEPLTETVLNRFPALRLLQ